MEGIHWADLICVIAMTLAHKEVASANSVLGNKKIAGLDNNKLNRSHAYAFTHCNP